MPILAGDDRVTDPRVLATKLVTADIALAYVDEVETETGQPAQTVVVLRRQDAGWTVIGAQGGDYPVIDFSVGVTPLGAAKSLPDELWAAVARTDDERVAAVELGFEGITHRYPVAEGALVIALPSDVGFELPYRHPRCRWAGGVRRLEPAMMAAGVENQSSASASPGPGFRLALATTAPLGSVVVLPAPLGPRSPSTVPSSTVRATPPNARTSNFRDR